ncbi:uncharacterized protein LAJ45_02942 [Morchella importuna]|uniref:uncharacterized protein n=1 Tax=Morchella importuna TaxID=1174673 RepID=UPI001E8DEDA4|nr:uncharacterized protein LAJ45_02942 [Morchella importuna]KAH8152718.1 hypothetical protein LAJ45_02942 [Morchella importuna]
MGAEVATEVEEAAEAEEGAGEGRRPREPRRTQQISRSSSIEDTEEYKVETTASTSNDTEGNIKIDKDEGGYPRLVDRATWATTAEEEEYVEGMSLINCKRKTPQS